MNEKVLLIHGASFRKAYLMHEKEYYLYMAPFRRELFYV